MLVRDGCQEKTSKTSNTLSRVMILGILLLQPSNTSRSLSLLKHRLNHLDPQLSTCISALEAHRQDSALRDPVQLLPASFPLPTAHHTAVHLLLTPEFPKSFPPGDTMNHQCSSHYKIQSTARSFMGKLSKFCHNEYLAIKKVLSGGEGQSEPEKGFCTLVSMDCVALWASHAVRTFAHVHLSLPTGTKGSQTN